MERNNISISVEEYTELLNDSIRLGMVKSIIMQSKYPAMDDVRILLGIKVEEE